MSSSRALCCFLSMKKLFASLTEQVIEKIVEDNDDKHRKVDEGGKGAVC